MKLSRPQKILRFFLVAAITMVVWDQLFNGNLPYVFRDLKIRDNESRMAEGIPLLEESMKIPGKDDPGSWSLYRKRGFEFIRPDSGKGVTGAIHFSKYVALENNRIVFEQDKYLFRREDSKPTAQSGKMLTDSVFAITSFRNGLHGDTPWWFRLELPEGGKKLGFRQAHSILKRWRIDLPEMVSRLEASLGVE